MSNTEDLDSEINQLSIDEVKSLLAGNPREMLKRTRELGINMDDLKFDVKKKLIQDGYGISDEDLEAVDFVYWVAYFVERNAGELIVDPQVKIGAQRITLEALVAHLSFGSKITIIQQLYVNNGDALLKMMRKIQDLRNHVAHGRFDMLKYDGHKLNKGHGQILIIADIRDAYLKAKEPKS